MPDIDIHKSLENEISRLGHEVKVIRDRRENRDLGKKDILKKTFRSVVSERDHAPGVSRHYGVEEKRGSDGGREFLPHYLREEGEELDKEVQLIIERLLDSVFHDSFFHKGVFHALRESVKFSPFIQDVFHDALAEVLIPEMEKRNLL